MASLQPQGQPPDTLPFLLAAHGMEHPWGGFGASLSPGPEGLPMPDFLSSFAQPQGSPQSASMYWNSESLGSSSSPLISSDDPVVGRRFQRAPGTPGSGAHRASGSKNPKPYSERAEVSLGTGAYTRNESRHASNSWSDETSPSERAALSWPNEGPAGVFGPADLLGSWADSLGNAVLVSSTDAYRLKLVATLFQPPRKDIHLSIRPNQNGGWNCGNAMLDPVWSSTTQLHWCTPDGRVSVWVRLPSVSKQAP